jgi:DNA-binding HxlR family transcriptional regulator/putative sterol carrier protein
VLFWYQMAKARIRDDGCGIAHASELLGQRWSLLVVRELLLGPKRFTDLRTGIPGLSPNVLGQRLRELEGAGLLRRRRLAPPAASQVYELTEWGRELEPAILALGRWASHSPNFPAGARMGPDSLVLAMKTTFQPGKAAGVEASYELRLGEIPYEIRVTGGGFEAERGEAADPDARIQADPDSLASVVFGGRSLTKAVKQGGIEVNGSRRAVNALVRALT